MRIFKIITGRNEQNCLYCYSLYLNQNISVFTFFVYFLTINMVLGKFSSLRKLTPRKFPPIKSPIPPGEFHPHRKLQPRKFQLRISPLMFFIFSLLSSLSLILLKRLFCISFVLICYAALKKFSSLPVIREIFWI